MTNKIQHLFSFPRWLKTVSMAKDGDSTLFNFASFLKEKEDEAFQEVDQACLSHQLFEDPECQRTILPLYFFLTRRAECRMSIRALKKSFNCGSDTIRSVRKAIEEKKPLKSPGRKRINPVRDDPALVALVDAITREDGALSDADLANLLGISRTSVNRIRHDLKFSYRPLRHGPRLEARQVEARLAFCLAHLNENWSLVLFTDESRFATSPDCPVMQWTPRGEAVYMETDKFPKSFMVWGGIMGNRKTPLLKCHNRMNADGYMELLEENGILDFFREAGGALFQQDGATCHTARKTMEWFEEKGVALLKGCPSNSPDLSPIEQVWSIAKCFIIKRYGMRTPLTLEQLETAVFEAYANIEPRTIAILTKSVEFRIRLCIERNGHFVGDALGECCRRARIAIASANEIQMFPYIQIPREQGGVGLDVEQDQEQDRPLASLPSFRSVQ